MEKDEKIEEPKLVKRTRKRKERKQIIKKILIIFAILIIAGGASGLFLLYGPYSGFRDWLITTAMTTMTHQYFATWFYDDETIQEVLNKNKVQEVDEITDTNTVVVDKTTVPKKEYANEYEKAVLEKDPNNDDYKIIDIKGKGYSGYLAVIYDPSRV